MDRTRYADVIPYTTKDGSEIRELMHPDVHGNRGQSLAEAIVPVAGETRLHRHHFSAELYHITAGHGRMTLGESVLEVAAGDTVSIPASTPHCIANIGDVPLRILCCCSPAYSHADTELL